MNFKWKLFRVLVIFEIISIACLVGFTFYTNPISINSSFDFFVISVIILIPIITTINGINIINILPLSHTENNSFFPRKMMFWIFGILFLLICLLVLAVTISLLFEWNKNKVDLQSGRWYQLGLILFFLVWVVNGIYIFVMQMLLFRSLKKAIRKNNIVDIEDIGEHL